MRKTGRQVAPVLAALVALVVLAPTPARADASGVTPRPSSCAPGSHPETSLQGEVTQADRASGRSTVGYSCNLSLLGQFQGQGATWVDPSYGHCAYVGQGIGGTLAAPDPGVRVIDVSDPAHPVRSAVLATPAMAADTWESLKVNDRRGLLAGVAVGPYNGVAFFDLYDVKTDCAHPRLLNSLAGTGLSIPANVIGHEGGWSPDGMTYWASGASAGSLTAIDVSDTSLPHAVWTGNVSALGHGFDISPDGNRMYFSTAGPAGMKVLDISQVQARAAVPVVTDIGAATWSDGTAPQHPIGVSQGGRQWAITVDEIGQAGIHLLDVTDPAHPVVHPGITLEIEQPEHAALASQESGNDTAAGLFGYSPHYCSVDRIVDPTALACGYFQAGVRVFDIRDLAHPKEIAYFNPPGQAARSAQLTGSQHANGGDLSVDHCSSPPRFVGQQLWVTCQDNGFLVLRFAAGTYGAAGPRPAKPAAPVATAPKAPTAPTAPPAPTAATRSTPGPAKAALASTGEPDWTAGLALALMGGAGILLAARRRSGPPRGVVGLLVVVLAVTFAGTVLVGQHAAGLGPGERFALDMIDHHEHAISMARGAEADARTSRSSRALAHQIVEQQSQEVTLLRSWLPASTTVADSGPRPEPAGGSPDRAFLEAMRAHHQAALPVIAAAVRDGDSLTRGVARVMQVEQMTELRWIDAHL